MDASKGSHSAFMQAVSNLVGTPLESSAKSRYLNEWVRLQRRCNEKRAPIAFASGIRDPGYHGVMGMNDLLTKMDVKHVWNRARLSFKVCSAPVPGLARSAMAQLINRIGAASLFAAILLPSTGWAAPPPFAGADEFLKKNCIACHGTASPAASLGLSKLNYELANPDNIATWVKVHDCAGERRLDLLLLVEEAAACVLFVMTPAAIGTPVLPRS